MANSQSRVSKNVYCKKAKISSNSGANENLRELLSRALVRFPKAHQRKECTNSEETQFRLINNFATSGGALCGIMLSYEKNANALALSEDETVEVYDVDSFVPPEKNGKRREFLEGLLYFAIQGNAVAIIQSKALRSGDFERYLYWLLKEASPDGKGVNFNLTDAVNAKIKERIEKIHVKSFEMNGQLVVEKDSDGNTVERNKQESSVEYGLGGLGVDVFDALKSAMPKLPDFKDALDENIDLTLRIKYNRVIGPKAQNLLDQLAMVLRNYEDADTKIILNDGGEINGHELKLKTKVKVTSLNGILSPDSVFAELSNLLVTLIKSGDIVV